MLPIWIIDLGSSAASTEKLRSLLGATGDTLRPYWHYHHVDAEAVADMDACNRLMDELVVDGRECYNTFSKAGYRVGNFQIVILGAADEALTQTFFAPLPGLLRDNLPRIISDHANRGVEITGILFIPSTINQSDDLRQRLAAAMMLEDLNMLCDRLGKRHYNRVVAYQDVQYKGNIFYPRLDTEQRTELLYQIIAHIFFASADSERLFDKIGDDCGIYSLGAASIYYNNEQHQSRELKSLLEKLLAEFKDAENSDVEFAKKAVRRTLEEEAIDADAVSARLRQDCGSLDVDLRKMDGEADPHPVWDLFRSDLFPKYYRKYLKYMPARLMRFMQSLSYVLLTKFAAVIRKNREQAVAHIKTLLLSFYKKVLIDTATPYTTIAQLEASFAAARDYLLKKRSEVELTLLEIVPVPKYLKNDYDKCLADEEDNKPSKIMERLKKNLKKEPVVLSLLVRCFLLGILLVFTVIPVLRVVSPNVINLGEIATIEWLWIPVLFLLPLVIEFFIKLRRHFARIKRLKYRLLATTLLAVNRRLSQFLMDEQGAFYDALVKECESQLSLLAEFREKLSVPDGEDARRLLAETMFSQPLLGGAFCGEKLIADDTLTEASIMVNDDSRHLSELEKEDLLLLLRNSFKQAETIEAADLSDGESAEKHAADFVARQQLWFAPMLDIHTAENVGLMLTRLGKDVDLAPMQKMAALNGMLFSVPSGNVPVLQITNAPQQFGHANLLTDKATADYALLTCWQKLSAGIQSQLVCNCQLQPLPPLSFADKLCLYYAFYQQRDLAYSLAGTPLHIAKEEMEDIRKGMSMYNQTKGE